MQLRSLSCCTAGAKHHASQQRDPDWRYTTTNKAKCGKAHIQTPGHLQKSVQTCVCASKCMFLSTCVPDTGYRGHAIPLSFRLLCMSALQLHNNTIWTLLQLFSSFMETFTLPGQLHSLLKAPTIAAGPLCPSHHHPGLQYCFDTFIEHLYFGGEAQSDSQPRIKAHERALA